MENQDEEVKDTEESTETNDKKDKKKKKKSKKKSPEKLLAKRMEEEILPLFLKSLDDPRWKFEKESKGVEIYRLIEEGEPIHKVKGKTTIPNCTVAQMLETLRTFPLCFEVSDPMFLEGSIPVNLAENSKVYNATFKMPGRPLVSDRNFVWVTLEKLLDSNSGVSLGYTLDYNDVYTPPVVSSNVVRGELKETGYYFKAVEGQENTVEMIYSVQVDVKGWLPVWVINMAAGDQAMNLYRIRKHFQALAEMKEENGETGNDSKKKKKKKKKNKKKKNQDENQNENQTEEQKTEENNEG